MSTLADFHRSVMLDAVGDRILCSLDDAIYVVYIRGESATSPTRLQLFSYEREAGCFELYAEDEIGLIDIFGRDWRLANGTFLTTVRSCMSPVLHLDGATRHFTRGEIVRLTHLLNVPLHRLENWQERDPANDPEFRVPTKRTAS